jgi:hypothetical protein
MTTNNSVNTSLAGQTGTGNFVGATSPTLVTPTIGAATATSVNFGGTSLANYVVGTWTPTFVGSSGGSAVYSAQTGGYTRIGDTVFFNIYIVLTSSTLSGNITISGLPLTVGAGVYFAGSIFANGLGATATPNLMALVSASTTVISLYIYTAGAATALTATNLGSTPTLVISGHYHV